VSPPNCSHTPQIRINTRCQLLLATTKRVIRITLPNWFNATVPQLKALLFTVLRSSVALKKNETPLRAVQAQEAKLEIELRAGAEGNPCGPGRLAWGHHCPRRCAALEGLREAASGASRQSAEGEKVLVAGCLHTRCYYHYCHVCVVKCKII
jgi:hypothetical protein